MREKLKKVGFICVHNSCRSQIAEFLGKKLGTNKLEAYSGGTTIKKNINSDAVNVIKKLYGEDMEKTQYPKLITDLPKMDILIAMG